MKRLLELRRRIDTAAGIRIPLVSCLARGCGGSAAGIALGYPSITVPPLDGGPVPAPSGGGKAWPDRAVLSVSGLGPRRGLALLRGGAGANLKSVRMRLRLAPAEKNDDDDPPDRSIDREWPHLVPRVVASVAPCLSLCASWAAGGGGMCDRRCRGRSPPSSGVGVEDEARARRALRSPEGATQQGTAQQQGRLSVSSFTRPRKAHKSATTARCPPQQCWCMSIIYLL